MTSCFCSSLRTATAIFRLRLTSALRFATLNPEVLRQALDETGIKWRVVAVSACFSGGFIEPLRSDAEHRDHRFRRR